MDPNKTLEDALLLLLDANDGRGTDADLKLFEAANHLDDLVQWLNDRGFAPDVRRVVEKVMATEG